MGVRKGRKMYFTTIMIVLFGISMGEAKDELESMKDMLMQMNQRVFQNEEKLANNENQLDYLTETVNGLLLSQANLTEALNDLATKEELYRTKNVLMAKAA